MFINDVALVLGKEVFEFVEPGSELRPIAQVGVPIDVMR